MRLVVLANVVWPEYGVEAGGTQHALAVADELARAHDVAVVVPAFTTAAIGRRFPRLALLSTPSPSALLGSTIGTLLFSSVSWVARAGAVRGADGVLAASHFLGDVLPAGLLKPRRAAVIVHHLVEPPWRRSGPFVRNLLGFVHERLSLFVVRALAGALVTSSQHVREQLRRAGFRQPIVVTTNAPRPLSAAPPPPETRVRGRVVVVGRLSPTKGLEMLVDAWAAVERAVSGATLHVVGDGDPHYRAALEARARTAAPGGSIVFLGRVDETRKERELFEAALFAFPSLEEGFGIALAEAMQAALPSVTFDLPVFRELFTAGRVAVPVGDAGALGAAIARLLNDDAARLALAAAALRGAGDFTWERAARRDLEAVELARRATG
ncbi:MAG TPA: glycosyltransferase [Candidatus Baltobacteraceae bacterium]|nr:glycosyltransferase [Candidatus Baltobacteraceae bacterium]